METNGLANSETIYSKAFIFKIDVTSLCISYHTQIG